MMQHFPFVPSQHNEFGRWFLMIYQIECSQLIDMVMRMCHWNFGFLITTISQKSIILHFVFFVGWFFYRWFRLNFNFDLWSWCTHCRLLCDIAIESRWQRRCCPLHKLTINDRWSQTVLSLYTLAGTECSVQLSVCVWAPPVCIPNSDPVHGETPMHTEYHMLRTNSLLVPPLCTNDSIVKPLKFSLMAFSLLLLFTFAHILIPVAWWTIVIRNALCTFTHEPFVFKSQDQQQKNQTKQEIGSVFLFLSLVAHKDFTSYASWYK